MIHSQFHLPFVLISFLKTAEKLLKFLLSVRTTFLNNLIGEGKYTNGKTLANLRRAPTKDDVKVLSATDAIVCVNVFPERFFDLFTEHVLKF